MSGTLERPSFDQDEPLTLAEACAYYRDRFTVSTLRSAHYRGELEFERLGRQTFVTLRELQRWRQRCRVSRKAQGSTTENPGAEGEKSSDPARGLSATEQLRLAQAAAFATVQKQKKPSKGTSRKNTVRSESAAVIPLISRRQT